MIQVRLLDGLKSSLLIPQGKGVAAITALFYQITALANLFYLRDEQTTKRSSRFPLLESVSFREPLAKTGALLTYRHRGAWEGGRGGWEVGQRGPDGADVMGLRSRVAEGLGDARPRPHPITPMRRR